MKPYRTHLLFALGTYILPILYGLMCPYVLTEQAQGGTVLSMLLMLVKTVYTVCLIVVVILTCGRRSVPVRLALVNLGIAAAETALLFGIPVLLGAEPATTMFASGLLVQLVLAAVAALIFSVLYYYKHRGE